MKKKRVISLLLVITILAGILPLSAINLSARTVTENRFEKAAQSASGKGGSGSYAGNSANFIASMLRADTTTYYGGFKWSNYVTSASCPDGTLEQYLINAGASSGADGYGYGDIIFLNGGNVGISVGGTTYYSNGSVVKSAPTSDFLTNYRGNGYLSGLPRAIYRYNYSYEVDDSVDLGDDFYAYINVVGINDSVGDYPNVRAKALTRGSTGTTDSGGNTYYSVHTTTPNYTDTKQIWHFKKSTQRTGGSYYYIENYDSDHCSLNLPSGNLDSGTDVQANNWAYRHGATETDTSSLWEFVARGSYSGSYYMKPLKAVDNNITNRVINMDGSSGYAHLYNSDGGGNEAFRVYKINELPSNRNVAISNVKNGNGVETHMTVNTSNNDVLVKNKTVDNLTSIIWTFERVNEGEYPPKYYIKNDKTGKYLQIATGSPPSFDINVADKVEGNEKQQWMLLGDSLNSLNFISVAYSSATYSFNNQVYGTIKTGITDAKVIPTLDMPGGNNEDGTSVGTWSSNYATPQAFKISYEGYPVDHGDFYSSLTLSVHKNGQKYAISLSKDGKNSSGGDYEDPKDVGVKYRKVSGTPAVDQQWYFKSLGDGTYAIQNLANGHYLYDYGSGTLRAYEEFKNEDNFKWFIVNEPEHSTMKGVQYFSIRSKDNFNKVFEVYGATLNNNGQAIKDTESSLNYTDANNSPAQGWLLDVDNKTSPAWGEDLGDTFWAYVSPVDYTNRYLHCGDSYNPKDDTHDAVNYCEEANTDLEKEKQENYWKFERCNDGSYKISSCNVQNSVLDRRNGNDGFNADKNVSIWENNTGYGQRWFIRKYANGYQIESKLDGRVLTLQSDYSVMVQTPDGSNTSQCFNITKTDLSIQFDLPNEKMRLFNYGRAINSADDAVLPFFNGSRNNTSYVDTDGSTTGVYDMSDVKPTMSKTLVNGYPYVENTNEEKYDNQSAKDDFTKTSGSLKYLFDDTKSFVKGNGTADSYNITSSNYKTDSNYQSQCFTVNNPTSLFKFNKANGLYYYDSLMNAAYFQRDTDSSGNQLTTGNFKLYDYTMSVPKAAHNGDYDYKKDSSTITGLSKFTGNFYPFNKAHEESDVDYGSKNVNSSNTDIGRQKITEDSAVKSDYFNVGDYAPVNYSLDGSSPIDCWFGMTLECQFEQTSDGTYDGKDVQFNFNGDDDVWVYMDGILVLNIGGTHGALEGTINFRTGEVKYPTGTSVSDGYTTTNLRALYQAVANQSEKYSFNGTTIDNDYIANNFTGNTFKRDTKHTLNFYYMERGGVVSSCKINFNLPKGTPSVTKKVIDSTLNFSDNTEYEFKLEKKVAENTYAPFGDGKESGVTYFLENADGSHSEEKVLPANGIFRLKANQTAFFHNINHGTEYRVTELASEGVSRTSAVYTRTVVYADGTKDVYTDDTMPEADGGQDYVTYTYKLQSNVTQNITFTNVIESTKLTVVKNVMDEDGNYVESTPDSVYNFGLHVYKNASDGSTLEYGTVNFLISGTELSHGYVIDGLPYGAKYDLWEYEPNDFTSYFYDEPEFEDNLQSGKVWIGNFVKADDTPLKDSGISGVLKDNTVTVTNKWIDQRQITVRIKYYDRNIVNGKPADIDNKETFYPVRVTGDEYKKLINGEISTEEIIKKAANIAKNASESFDNVIDSYVVWTSQKAAKEGIAEQMNLHTNSKYAQSDYHTDCYGNPQTSGEKWVTYTSYTKDELFESNGKLSKEDLLNLREIDIWLFNKPKEYTITYYEAKDVTDESLDSPDTYVCQNIALSKTISGIYYNQRLGEEKDNQTGVVEGPTNHLDKYGITNSITKSISTPKEIKVNGTSYLFKGWATDATGKMIVSSDIRYRYRITKDITLYPVYSKSKPQKIGLNATANSIDLLVDREGQKTRLNTMMNPYGCVDSDVNISKAAVIYVTDAKGNIASNKQSVQAAIQSALSDSNNSGAKFSTNVSGIGKANYFVHAVGRSHVNLTSKNRLQFTTTFNTPVLKNQKFAAFVAMKYNDTWIVSDNYIYYECDSNGKVNKNNSVAVK